ncbi:UBA domain-containing protein rup1, partial [Monosporozyma unispora]
MEQGIQSLMEMGIPIDVATDAMQRTDGNLENAVNFIFSNELPPEQQHNNINE